MKIQVIDNGNVSHSALFQKTVLKRIDAVFGNDGLSLELKIDPTISSAESYIIKESEGGYLICGSDKLGLYYGIGKFLHTAKWTENEFFPNPPKGVQCPDCSFRASYFAIHFFNWYHRATEEELTDYMEELLLWGYNIIDCTLPKVNCNGVNDPKLAKAVETVRNVFKLAKKVGMRVSLNTGGNSTTNDVTDDILADYSCYDKREGGNQGKNVCTSNPKGLEFQKKLWDYSLKSFQDIGLDYMIIWPYDEGGCGCPKCRPWGAVGYPNMIHHSVETAKSYHPDIKVIASTWFFDYPIDFGEYKGFYSRLKTDLSPLVDYIMVDSPEDYPQYPLTHEVVKPIINFPEISMFGVYPWGGRGAVPMLKRFQNIWDASKAVISGGMPYSEGLYEDSSKVQFAGYYWDRDRSYQDIMAEYINYEFSADCTDEIIRMMELIEVNHVGVSVNHVLDSDAYEKAYELALSIDAKLPDKKKTAWRWRILYIRVMIDKKIYDYFTEKGQFQDEPWRNLTGTNRNWLADDQEAQDLLQELCGIYKCVSDNGENRWTRPPVKDGIVL